jgi:hypothetical protein
LGLRQPQVLAGGPKGIAKLLWRMNRYHNFPIGKFCVGLLNFATKFPDRENSGKLKRFGQQCFDQECEAVYGQQ